LPAEYYVREAVPWEAAFLAGRAYVPIAVAADRGALRLPTSMSAPTRRVAGHTLLTRDRQRYGSYFPKLRIVAP
jgi:hypothetical protein